MRRNLSIVLLCLVVSILSLPSSSHAQNATPTFEATRITHWSEGETDRPSARISGTSHRALTDVLSTYDLYTLNAKAIERYVKDAPGAASFQLSLGDEYQWNITLEPNDLLSPKYQSFALTPQGEEKVVSSSTVTFRGKLNTEGGGEVRMLLDGGKLKGFVTYRGKKLYLENLSDLTEEADDSQFVFYAEDEVQEDGSLVCMAKEEASYKERVENRINERASNGCEDQAQLEIATLALYERFRSAGSSQTGVNNEILGILNNVQANYTQFSIKFKVTEQVVSTCASCDPWTTTNPSDILSQFTNWGSTGFKNSHDAGICFFQGNGSGTVGVAWVGAICTSSRYSVCDKLSTSESNRVLVAHEMGHNFGANHDSGGAPFIMAPSVSTSTEWSSASIRSVNDHIASRSCLACVADDGENPQPPTPDTGCATPTNLTASNVTATTVRLSIDDASDEGRYRYQFRIKGGSRWESFVKRQKTTDVEGLRPATDYQWRAQTECKSESETSDFIRGPEFKTRSADSPTPSACKTPASPSVLSRGTTTASFTWIASASAKNYEFRIRQRGDSRWFAFPLVRTTINISGMRSSTTYEWQLRTICDTGPSAYTSLRQVTTFGSSNQVASNATTTPLPSASSYSLHTASEIGLISLNKEEKASASATVHTDLLVYPNPSTSDFRLELPISNELIGINIFDIQGRMIRSYQHRLEGAALNLGEKLPPGAYTLQVVSPSFQGRTKVIKGQ